MPRRKTLEEYKEEIYNYYGFNPYTFTSEYKNKDTKIKAICNTCKNKISFLPSSLNTLMRKKSNSYVCIHCNEIKTLDYYNNLIYERDKYIPYKWLEEYKGSNETITAICLRCKNKIKVIPSKIQAAIKNGNPAPCKECAYINSSKLLRKSTDKYKKELDSVFIDNNGYTLLEDYIRMEVPILHRCNICHYEWKISPTNVLAFKYGRPRACPCCNNMIHDIRDYSERVSEVTNGKITNIEPYIKRNKAILHFCNDCHYEWKVKPENILSGNLCPNCSKANTGSSSYESKIYEFIKDELGIDNIILNSRKLLPSRKEIDIYLPDYKLGIEINGLYWHSEKYKDKNYHVNKLQESLSQGINLLQFYDRDIDLNEDIVKDKIRHMLGLSNYKIYARNCIIREVKTKEKTNFLNNNHLQGAVGSKYNIGLFYNEDLVAIMTFALPRRSLGQKSDSKSIELIRYATKINNSVVGGFSKLLSYFKKSKLSSDFDKIITYADRNISTGNLYSKNGFSLTHISKPSYFYVDKGTYQVYNRFKFRKNSLEKQFPDFYDPNLTEFQIMDLTNKYYRVWNTGNNAYELRL